MWSQWGDNKIIVQIINHDHVTFGPQKHHDLLPWLHTISINRKACIIIHPYVPTSINNPSSGKWPIYKRFLSYSPSIFFSVYTMQRGGWSTSVGSRLHWIYMYPDYSYIKPASMGTHKLWWPAPKYSCTSTIELMCTTKLKKGSMLCTLLPLDLSYKSTICL